jgi:hypothetical protein
MPSQISREAKLPRRSRAMLPSSPAALAAGRHTLRVQFFQSLFVHGPPLGPIPEGLCSVLWNF